MEESAIARLCRILSSILTVFSTKQAIPQPEISPPTTNVYVDEKHQIEQNNIQQNAIEKDPE